MINYRLKINFQDTKVLTSDICFVSGDIKSNRLIFEFYDEGKRVDISNYTLSVRAKRSDGAIIASAGRIENNTGIFIPESNIFAVPGDLYMEIALSDASGKYATTKIIIASVVQGLGEAAIEGADNLSVYVTLLNQVQSKLDQANALIEKSVSGAQNGTGEKAEIFNDYETNEAYGDYTHAEGYASAAGMMGFYYYSIEFGEDSDTITLTDKQNELSDKDFSEILAQYPEGAVISLVNNSKYPNCAKILSIEGNIITVEKLPFDTVTDVSAPSMDDYSFWVEANPEIGVVSLGWYAHSEGEKTKALERASHAEGRDTEAIGQYSHAEGRGTKAGYAAHSEGYGAEALGIASHAEGHHSKATASYGTHAEGSYTTASGSDGAHSEGSYTQAEGESSHAEGRGTFAKGVSSHSEGNETVANGAYSHAEGNHAQANGENSHAEGSSTYANGSYSHAEGYETSAVGISAHSEGYGAEALGIASHAEGNETTAEALACHAEGYGTNATNHSSHSEGFQTTASGQYGSHAEGKGSVASGENGSHAEGCNTKATNYASHSEGLNTEASGQYGSHAEGRDCIASGAYGSHAEGSYTTASGAHGAHAEGSYTVAQANYSHAEGLGTVAASTAQHVEGQYNVKDDNLRYVHIVGGGTGDTDRKNIHTLDWVGNAEFAGTVKCVGVILTSPNGTKFKLIVDDNGSLATEVL